MWDRQLACSDDANSSVVYYLLSVEQDDAETRGHGDAERNVSQPERLGHKSLGFQSPTESLGSVALFQEGLQSPNVMSPRLPLSASPRLFLEGMLSVSSRSLL